MHSLFPTSRTWQILTFKTTWYLTVGIVLLSTFLLVFLANGPDFFFRSMPVVRNLADQDADLYARWIDPVLTLFTFVLAFIIGYQNLRKEWEENMSKRLSVVFLYQAKDDPAIPTNGLIPGQSYPLIIYFESTLGVESDIRAWALQLGKQATGEDFLKLKSKQSFGKKETLFIPAANKFVMHYTYTCYLSELPERVKGAGQTIVIDEHHSDAAAISQIPFAPMTRQNRFSNASLKTFVAQQRQIKS